MKYVCAIFTVLFVCGFAIASDQTPGSPQKQAILLFGGDVYPISGEVIHGGEVLFDKGAIVAVGKNLDDQARSISAHSASTARASGFTPGSSMRTLTWD